MVTEKIIYLPSFSNNPELVVITWSCHCCQFVCSRPFVLHLATACKLHNIFNITFLYQVLLYHITNLKFKARCVFSYYTLLRWFMSSRSFLSYLWSFFLCLILSIIIMSKKVNQSQRFLVAPKTFQYLETSANLTGIQFREVLLYLDFFSMNNT